MSSSLFSGSWLPKLATDLDINAFVKSFKFDTKVKNCGIDDIHDSVIGIEMSHLDLFMFTETVREKGFVIYMDSNILGKKTGKARGIIGEGSNRGQEGSQYVNMVQLPILGLISGALGFDGIACFHPSDKIFFYSSAVDPTSADYIQFYMLMDSLKMYTINGIMSMIADCMSYQSYKYVDKSGTTAKYLSMIIDSYNHSFGCNGGIASGNSNQSASPLVNGLIQSATTMKIMARTGVVIKQTKRSLLNPMGSDVTCNQSKGPFIKTEFLPQMLQPISTATFEMGETPAKWAAFRDNQTTRGNTAIGWWVRKDFTAFAGHCTW